PCIQDLLLELPCPLEVSLVEQVASEVDLDDLLVPLAQDLSTEDHQSLPALASTHQIALLLEDRGHHIHGAQGLPRRLSKDLLHLRQDLLSEPASLRELSLVIERVGEIHPRIERFRGLGPTGRARQGQDLLEAIPSSGIIARLRERQAEPVEQPKVVRLLSEGTPESLRGFAVLAFPKARLAEQIGRLDDLLPRLLKLLFSAFERLFEQRRGPRVVPINKGLQSLVVGILRRLEP